MSVRNYNVYRSCFVSILNRRSSWNLNGFIVNINCLCLKLRLPLTILTAGLWVIRRNTWNPLYFNSHAFKLISLDFIIERKISLFSVSPTFAIFKMQINILLLLIFHLLFVDNALFYTSKPYLFIVQRGFLFTCNTYFLFISFIAFYWRAKEKSTIVKLQSYSTNVYFLTAVN